MRVLFAGGGTGGHIFPLLAVAAALRDNPEVSPEFHWLGSDRLDEELVPKAGITHTDLRFYFQRWPLKPAYLLKYLQVMATLAKLQPFRRALGEMRSFDPDLVMSTGNYIAWPTLELAEMLDTPVVLLSVDHRPGLVIRLFAPRASRIFAVEPDALPRHNLTPTEVPRRLPRQEEIDATAADYELDSAKKVLVVTGGSQGSRALNEMTAELVPLLEEDWQIVLQKGIQQTPELPDRVRTVDFEPRLDALLARADAVLSRAGAGTVSLIGRLGVPAVLVPMPGVDDHQTENARSLKREGHPVEIISEETPADQVTEMLRDLAAAGREQGRAHPGSEFNNAALDLARELEGFAV